MATVAAERVSAELDGEFVVFLIGLRINRLWKIHKWLPVFRARKKMLAELMAHPESGCMSHNKSGGIAVLYWRTFEQLEYLTRGAAKELWPAWSRFNEALERSKGDVGVWREIYVIKRGQYEADFSDATGVGLGLVRHLEQRSGSNARAGERLKAEVA